MRGRILLTALVSVVLVPAAYCWEYTYTFDGDEGWSFFDNDTGAGTAAAPSGGVLSVNYPGAASVRYIFADKDSAGEIFGNVDLTGGSLTARLSYSGSVAPTFAYFFLAGGGDAGDDQIYLTGEPGSWQGGTQTFRAASSTPLVIGTELAWTSTVDFTRANFSVMSVGSVHNARRGTADSWAATISSVDAVGIALGFVGTPPADAKLNIDEFTVTPEPSALLLMGPMAGFLAWRIRRRTRKTAIRA
jgi:hypothetical protein